MNAAADWICKVLAAAGLLALLGFAVITLANGISRSLVSYPIEIVGDAGSLIVAVSVASCFPMALWLKSNIRIDLLSTVLPIWAHGALGVAAESVILVVTAAVARQMFVYAGHAASAGDSTAMLEIETAPFWFYVAAMLAVSACVQLLVIGRALSSMSAVSPIRPGSPTH